MAKLPNLDDMTSKELKELRNQVDVAIVERTKADRADLKAQMEAMAAASGLSLDDVLGGSKGKGSRGTVAIKYRNPDDFSQTWTGRGRKPNWLTEKLAKRGAKIEDYAL